MNRRSHDVQALRTLLERLESEHPYHGSDPRFPGTAAVARQRREELVARINAYSALVMHSTAGELMPPPFPREVAKLIHAPIDNAHARIATLRELVPKHYAEEGQ